MKAERNKVVFIHYSLADESGSPVEDNFDEEPTALLMGHSNMMRGLESALGGREEGESFEVTLKPEEAYGPKREDQLQRVSKKHFAQPKRLRIGDLATLRTEQGQRSVTIVKVGSKFVDVDLNHPLAGQTVQFKVKVVRVRDATPVELAHGHAHADGQDHH